MAAANAPISGFCGGFFLVMDYGGDVGQIIFETPGSRGGADNWVPGLRDPAIWSTEDDYGAWNGNTFANTPSNLNYDGRKTQTRSASESPNKKTGDSQGNGLNRDRNRDRSKAIGKMFFKTKLCRELPLYN
ncbi:hypothetical protein NE237_020010 [Protea cynaroides]|uniref:Uncharacterized protein n=1 Tax=Protea cynaroides TaxID=273540 RepID=A0A9Q0H8L6_9MAGN|nr:hypothetical protein NE237_020010 [Protea cynaroides]